MCKKSEGGMKTFVSVACVLMLSGCVGVGYPNGYPPPPMTQQLYQAPGPITRLSGVDNRSDAEFVRDSYSYVRRPTTAYQPTYQTPPATMPVPDPAQAQMEEGEELTGR